MEPDLKDFQTPSEKIGASTNMKIAINLGLISLHLFCWVCFIVSLGITTAPIEVDFPTSLIWYLTILFTGLLIILTDLTRRFQI